jgi:branched-chain amino acid transport system substrate-binding protein
VPVILGGVCSGETMAFTATAEKAKTVVLSPCSSNPAITNAGDYIFRNYPSDNYQGTFAANYIFNTLGKKKVAVLYIQNDYAVGIRGIFVDAFKKLGGTIVADESAAASATDFRAQLTKIKAANPDLVYSLGMADEATVSIKQAKELGINVPFFGADAWGDAKIWSGLGSAGEGDMYTTVSTPLTAAFTSAMKAKTGTDVTICSPEAYDGIKLLAQVISKVGIDSTKIKNELYKTVYNGGVSADKISFDSNGDLVGASYTVYVVHNGVASPVK